MPLGGGDIKSIKVLKSALSETSDSHVKPSPAEIREYLERILASPVFRGSRRSNEFLRFVVEHALAGNTDILKERTIGAELFGRDAAYDTAGDAIVRVNANDVRKRLAQYYQGTGAREQLLIHLPAGAYVSEFQRVTAAAGAPKSLRSATVWAVSVVAVLLAVVVLVLVWDPFPSDIDRFWAPVLKGRGQPIVCMGSSQGARVSNDLRRSLEKIAAGDKGVAANLKVAPADIIPMEGDWVVRGNFFALLDVGLLLQRYGKPAAFRPSVEVGLEELRDRPVIFIGAFNNQWTLDLVKELRFRFEVAGGGDDTVRMVVDRANPQRRWTISAVQPSRSEVDYALITRLAETGKRSIVISAAGIRWYGTQAAGHFITNPERWREVARAAPPGWHRGNMQIVLETKVIGKTPSPPRILDMHFW